MWRFALLGVLALAPCVWAGDLPSGPAVGDKLQEFKVLGFSGSEAGKEFEVLKQAKNGPTLLVFVHQISRPLFQLLRPVDAYASKEEKLARHIIWLSTDKDETIKFLERAKNSLNLQTPVSVTLDGKDGPPAYGLNDKVAVTILIAKDKKVVANFAYADPNDTVAPKVIDAIAKAVGKEAPKAKEDDGKKEGRSPELQKLMRRMIQKDNDEATVKRIVEAMKTWAGDDKKKQEELCGLLPAGHAPRLRQ